METAADIYLFLAYSFSLVALGILVGGEEQPSWREIIWTITVALTWPFSFPAVWALCSYAKSKEKEKEQP